GVIEFRCLLARRRRAGDIGRRIERRIVETFERDVAQGFLEVHPLDDRQALGALEILSSLERHPLRTLDALHLAAAGEIGATVIATADRVMAAAAKALGFSVERFD
ncbi:MAG: type II toxin-antitoxin system VapC family toxin, partial [Alphaproteobacteria bacterium]